MTDQAEWPDGVQAAAIVTVNFNGESVEQRAFPGQPLWGRNSYGRYGAQTGVDRLLAAFERHDMRATFFIPAWDVERYPDVMERIVAAGHEVAGHGYAYEDFSDLSLDEQTAILDRSEEIFRRALGTAPAGWRAPDGLMTSGTRGLLISRGYTYDSSFCDDDLPYLARNDDGQQLVEIPVFSGAGDRMYYTARRPPHAVARAWHEELAASFAAGALFNLNIHPRGDYGSGRAVRVRAVDSILQEMRELPRLWMTTCGEMAEYVLSRAGQKTVVSA